VDEMGVMKPADYRKCCIIIGETPISSKTTNSTEITPPPEHSRWDVLFGLRNPRSKHRTIASPSTSKGLVSFLWHHVCFDAPLSSSSCSLRSCERQSCEQRSRISRQSIQSR